MSWSHSAVPAVTQKLWCGQKGMKKDVWPCLRPQPEPHTWGWDTAQLWHGPELKQASATVALSLLTPDFLQTGINPSMSNLCMTHQLYHSQTSGAVGSLGALRHAGDELWPLSAASRAHTESRGTRWPLQSWGSGAQRDPQPCCCPPAQPLPWALQAASYQHITAAALPASLQCCRDFGKTSQSKMMVVQQVIGTQSRERKIPLLGNWGVNVLQGDGTAIGRVSLLQKIK